MKNNFKKIATLSLIPLTMGGVSMAAMTGSHATLVNNSVNANYSVVNTDSLNVRSGPGATYPSIGGISRGTVITGIVSNGWVKIATGEFTGNWVSANYMSKTTAPATPNTQSTSGTVFKNTPEFATNTTINIRSGPGSSYPVAGTVEQDSLLSGKIVNGWVKIDDGMYAGKYASAYYVKHLKSSQTSVKTIAGTPLTSNTITLSQAETNLRKRIISVAETQAGKAYLWGGDNVKDGFDCSGYSSWVYRQVGIYIPRTSYQQAPASTPKTAETAKLGDLVFLKKKDGTVYHVGILLNSTSKTYWNSPDTGDYIRVGTYSFNSNVIYGSFIR